MASKALLLTFSQWQHLAQCNWPWTPLCHPSPPCASPVPPATFNLPTPPKKNSNFPFCIFTTCFRSRGRMKWFCKSKCPSADGQTWHGGRWRTRVGGWGGAGGAAPTAAECDKMQSGILCPPRSRIGPEKEHVRGTMACPSRSRRVWVTAAMFIGRLRWQSGQGRGRGGWVLFRQELGLSSDSKILLIYDVSTAVFSPTPLTSADRSPAGKRWHSVKLFVCLLLTFNAEDRYQARQPGALQHLDLRFSHTEIFTLKMFLYSKMYYTLCAEQF